MLSYDRELHEQEGYRDAMAGRPRALGGTAAGYRRGYDLGLFDWTARLRAARATTEWCRCETTDEQEAYYLRENGRHGWFHDPALGGCGGITQTG